MLTSFLTSRNYRALSATYVFDDQVDFKNYLVAVDGGLHAIYSPVLSGNQDFINNNYSFLNITPQLNIDDITDINVPTNNQKLLVGTIHVNTNEGRRYLALSDQLDDSYISTLIFDQTINTPTSALNDLNYFEVDISHPYLATISKLYSNEKYFLSFNPANTNLNFVILSGFTGSNNFTRLFYYFYDSQNNTITLQAKYNGFSYRVYNNQSTGRLGLGLASQIGITDTRSILYLSAFKYPDSPALTIDWGSYSQQINQNNIEINSSKSYFGINNNFLAHTEYLNADKFGGHLPTNLLTLKNQLNINYHQGRGNVFLDRSPVNYRNYVSVMGGGSQERGYENMHLQFESYSTPVKFKQSKTTWFHTPQNMYPYSRLNIADTKLIEAGAIASDHPLRSDKVFKKLANYERTSNQGNSTGEQTGKWLCAWLSGGDNFNIKPVWVDRYYNPTTLTPYQAISVDPGSMTYISSFDCANLPAGISDVPSSLTFEPGCWYAYSRIGTSDAVQNIQALNNVLKNKNFSEYLRSDGSLLGPEIEDFPTYNYRGREYSYFNVDNFNLTNNNFTLAFWMYRDDWNIPAGFQLLGNYNDYGIGLFNYNLVTPFLLYRKGNKLVSLNKDLEELNVFDSGVPTFGNVQYILRRDALNSFHCITDTQNILEFDIKETLIDTTNSLSASISIKDVHNDEGRGYVLYTDNSVKSFNLFTNQLEPVSANFIVGLPVVASDVKEIVKLIDGRIATVAGTQTKVRQNELYFLSGGFIHTFNTLTNTLCTFIGNLSSGFTTFNIDKYGQTWVGKNNLLEVYGPFQIKLFSTTLSVNSSISTSNLDIRNITYIENFDSGQLIESVVVAASGSSTTDTVLLRLDYSGKIEKVVSLDTQGVIDSVYDPANHDFNYSYLLNRYPEPLYNFKLRLYNQLNNEDVEIPGNSILSKDLGRGWHHFSFVVNVLGGQLLTYVDGTLYGTTPFTPNKYTSIPLITDRIFAGASSYYGGLLLFDILDQNKSEKTSYLCKDFKIQNLYFYNKVLNYTDVNMLFKEKIAPVDLTWDMPSGRRNFMDVPSRFFKQKVPGSKSTLYNVYINDSLLDSNCKDYLQVAILNKLKEITPAYSKVNNLQWITVAPSLTADYLQPYFPGNTLTTGELSV